MGATVGRAAALLVALGATVAVLDIDERLGGSLYVGLWPLLPLRSGTVQTEPEDADPLLEETGVAGFVDRAEWSPADFESWLSVPASAPPTIGIA